MSFHCEFDFDLARALADQLDEVFGDLECGPFEKMSAIELVERRQGVYLLYLHDQVVYVGKANRLRDRITKHHRKIIGRKNVNSEDMGFKCVYLHKNWAPIGTEEILIKRHQAAGLAQWNGSSFGSNDPGRERDTTAKPDDQFDAQYPINTNWRCCSISAGRWEASELLATLKEDLPYLFRYQRQSATAGHPSYNGRTIEVAESAMSAERLLLAIAKQIPNAKATIFSSHMILYMNDERRYPHGRVIWPV